MHTGDRCHSHQSFQNLTKSRQLKKKASKKRRKRKARKKTDAVYFRSTIIAWGPSSGYAPAKPAVTLTRAEERKLQKPGLIRESQRNRSRRRAEKGMRTWRKKRESLEPMTSTPNIESLVTAHDSVEDNQKGGLRLEPILSTRKLEANAKLKQQEASDEGNDDKAKETVGMSEDNADSGKSPLTDAEMFANIANNLANVVEAEQTDSIIRIKNQLGEIVDASDLKMMQDILAEKKEMEPMDPNEPPPDAQVGELESEETLPPSLDSYGFQDKDSLNLASCFEPV